MANQTCADIDTRDYSDALRYYSLAYSITMYSIVVATVVFWRIHRNDPLLRGRHPRILFFFAAGVCMYITTTPLWRYDPGLVGPCFTTYFFYLIAIPTIAIPLNVTLILWVNRIKYNYDIAQFVGKQYPLSSIIRMIQLLFQQRKQKRVAGFILLKLSQSSHLKQPLDMECSLCSVR